MSADARAGGAFARLRRALERSRARLGDLFTGARLDEAEYEALEARLLSADVGIETTEALLDALRAARPADAAAARETLRRLLREALPPPAEPFHPRGRPHCVLVVGVNGSGKTTTLGKLAAWHRAQGRSVLLAAGDTYRAAAAEQLAAWGERCGVPVLRQAPGADAAALIHDAYAHARARGIEVLLADTAGRLHNRDTLMAELAKIKRVLGRLDPEAPQDTLLVLDATTGQNALEQAKRFHEAIGLSGLVVTKLDGSARAGVLFAVHRALGLPVHWVGLGEGLEDLAPFDPDAFVSALLDG
ncbi:MAG: hypothetical protein KatS3mg121_0995 [Gammaproteobacteria bacterium]|nr:MAG: hypothetical protein KatS3mg121_0995 [Gammaproteobacteria bacterium]